MTAMGFVALSLFSGAGGLDLGATQAGFDVRAAVEMNKDAVATLEKNFPGIAVIDQDVLGVPTAEILRAAGLKGRSRPDLLIGGPPCTPFSKSGFWLDWKREGLDPNASLLNEYTRVLKEARPRAFVLENVYALTYNNRASRPPFLKLLAEIEEAGYDCAWQVLNAADFGVAQLRPRLFIVGAPKGKKQPQLPAPTHFGTWERRHRDDAGGRLPHVTTGEALCGLMTEPEREEVVRGQWAHLLPKVPPGDNYLHFTERRGCRKPLFEWRSRYWSFLLKLDPERPSPTIQAQPGPNVGPFHWNNRRLRVAEVKRLFGFPDDFEIVGSRNSVQVQLGNSVCPPLAARVCDAVAQSL
jgi:DNA (cytosine-5)-methyltransferase 1